MMYMVLFVGLGFKAASKLISLTLPHSLLVEDRTQCRHVFFALLHLKTMRQTPGYTAYTDTLLTIPRSAECMAHTDCLISRVLSAKGDNTKVLGEKKTDKASSQSPW